MPMPYTDFQEDLDKAGSSSGWGQALRQLIASVTLQHKKAKVRISKHRGGEALSG